MKQDKSIVDKKIIILTKLLEKQIGKKVILKEVGASTDDPEVDKLFQSLKNMTDESYNKYKNGSFQEATRIMYSLQKLAQLLRSKVGSKQDDDIVMYSNAK